MLTDKVIEQAARLKWIQTLGTGVDNLIDQPALRKDVIVTNVRGIHGAAGLGSRARDHAGAGPQSAAARCAPRTRGNGGAGRRSFCTIRRSAFSASGSIAEALAPKCKAFGMRVVGVSSAPRAVAGIRRACIRATNLLQVVGEFDFFVLLTPLTAATRNSIDAKVFAAMKPSSFLVNLARGGVVDEAGAGRGAQRQTPCRRGARCVQRGTAAADHPFWSMQNVIITTHQGGFCDVYIDYAWPTVETNMRRFLSGDIAGMINVVAH